MSSDTLQVLIFVCPTVSELRFYECFHSFFLNKYHCLVSLMDVNTKVVGLISIIRKLFTNNLFKSIKESLKAYYLYSSATTV